MVARSRSRSHRGGRCSDETARRLRALPARTAAGLHWRRGASVRPAGRAVCRSPARLRPSLPLPAAVPADSGRRTSRSSGSSLWGLPAARNLISIDEALRLVLACVEPLPAEIVRLEAAAGRVLAEGAAATVDLPPFDSSAMDGFALRSADTPGRLPVVHRIPAGTPAPRSLEAGESMGIATGALVPEGSDAVVPLEYVVESDNTIEIEEVVELGANVRPAGGDTRAGETVVEAGMLLGPRHVAALAAAGVPEVHAARRPRAAVVVTGSELRPPGEPLSPGQIYESNGVLLEAQLRSAGAEVERTSPVLDEEPAHREA